MVGDEKLSLISRHLASTIVHLCLRPERINSKSLIIHFYYI